MLRDGIDAVWYGVDLGEGTRENRGDADGIEGETETRERTKTDEPRNTRRGHFHFRNPSSAQYPQ